MAIPIINLSILNGSNGFRLDWRGVYSSVDSVSSAGDINGDGFDDVMVGVSYDGQDGFFGTSYVVFGKASGFDAALDLFSLDGSNGFRLDAQFPSFPLLVSSAGDMNGDGFDDVILGAPGTFDYYGNLIEDGTGYVVFGRASGFTADINLFNLDGSDGFRLDVTGSRDVSVSSAGDVNGDGFDDVIVGDPGAANGSNSGSSYVVFGKTTGFDATLDLASLDGSNGFRLDGVAAVDRSGDSVSSAGDINGDGFDDVIVGAPGADPNGSSSGSSYVVFGKASGFAATLDLASLDGSNGIRLNGIAEGGQSGASVSSAGDVNGDDLDDVIVSAGAASCVVFGKASGFSAAMDLSSLNGNNGFRLDDGTRGVRVSNAGDVNGDGFDDVIVGIVDGGYTSGFFGASYVVFGKASGFAAALDLSSLDGNDGFRLESVAGAGLGGSISGAGDVNNDGFDDLIIGGGFSNSTSYVVFGGNFLNEAIYLGTPGDDNLTGTTLAERFEAGDGNDRMSGLGGADIFHGDAGDDTIVVAESDLDFQLLDGGIGTDTLELTGGGINLDLASSHDRIDGIETIDLTGSGDNTWALTLPDLLSLSGTTDAFTVNGNAGDRVAGLVDGWTDGGVDGDYRIFTNSGTTLRVHLAVRTEVPTPGVISLADLDGDNGFRVDGAERDDRYGRSISDAGDVNGDGFDDVIIGAPYSSFGGTSYVVFGKASGFVATLDLTSLDGSNGFRVDGEAVFNRSGESVSSAGDVNGDGFDDVIIGAPLAGPNGDRSGSSHVVFGKASGFDAAMDLSSLDGSNGFRLDGTAAGDVSGESVSSAGDVNGDGFDDVIVGTVGADPNGDGSGSSYVVFGKATGFDAAMNLSNLDGSNGFRLDGAAELDRFGDAVSNAGDVNGDGFDDVIVGAYGADPNGDYSGASYVVFGKASGFNATLDLSSLDGSNGFRLDGVAERDFSGRYAVSSNAGDVNGDGFADVIVGAYGADPNGDYSGSSYVVFGKASGFNATLDLSKLDGSNGFRIDGAASRDYLGISVSNAGDVNGDGFDDVIVGAYGADPTGGDSDAGSSYLVFGRASGFSATLNLSNLDSSTGIRLDGAAGGDHSGESVSGAGDVNGDGFDDLLVGAPRADPNGNYDAGSSYVIFGRSDFGGGNVIEGTAGEDILKGTPAAEIFEAGAGNDRMIGRGGADVFHGDAGDDDIKVSDLGFGLVDGGTGDDVLHLAGSDLNLDLANFGDKIHGIETICIYGRGDNTLTLTAADLLNLSDTDNTLRVNGNAGDHITVLDDGWVDEGSRGQGYFHVYTNDDAVLLVGMNVTVDFV